MRNAVQPNQPVQTSASAGARILEFTPLRGQGRDSEAARVLRLVAEARGVPAVLLLHPSRCSAEVAEARQIAMYLMHVVLRRSFADIGACFRRDRTTVSHACARIEDRRDVPDFDAFLTRLETRLTSTEGERADALR